MVITIILIVLGIALIIGWFIVDTIIIKDRAKTLRKRTEEVKERIKVNNKRYY